MTLIEQVKKLMSSGEIDLETQYHVGRLVKRYEEIEKLLAKTNRMDIVELELIRIILKEP